MGYRFTLDGFNALLKALTKDSMVFAPRRYTGQGEFSDTDSIRYGPVTSAEEIELEHQSQHTFKEALTPISETLFYYTENSVRVPEPPVKQAVILLRSCDLHAVKRQDEIYLRNGFEDSYYKRLREKARFILIGCPVPFKSCFCVDMGSNRSEDYDASLDYKDGHYLMDCKNEQWQELFGELAESELSVTPSYVTDTPTRVNIPDDLDISVYKSKIWDEYDTRCISCGRCNFSCPTCTCYTMQDMFYTDNDKAGERRRVWASCMVDGFTDVAGGGRYRVRNGERMRFKVLHKVLDYKQRFGYHMCVGCGRCDDVCPEYISYSHAVNRLSYAMEEVKGT